MERRSYPHVLEAILARPWAIRPELLPVIAEIVARRISGEHLQAQEIRARVGAAPATRPVRTVGAVAVLPLYGVLFPKASMLGEMSGGTSLARFRASFREAIASPQVTGIVLDIDSPGGLVDLVPETAADIRSARGSKPIIAIANTEAASAAYWLGSQADELVVTPSGMVGSIGVFTAHDDVSRAMEIAGVRRTLISAGRYKVEANPFEPLSDEARAAIQTEIDEYYRMFTTDVAKGRRVGVDAVRSGYGEGRMLTARRAAAEGMVDGVETLESVLRRAGARAATGAGAAGIGGGRAAARELERPEEDFDVGQRGERGPASLAGPIPPHDTDVVDRPWDADREVSEISNEAGEPVLRRMYAWQDDDADPDTKAAYRLPHHEVEDGLPGPANVNGVRNALSRLPQSAIPEADHDGCKAHLRRHLDSFNEGAGGAKARARERALRLWRHPSVTGGAPLAASH